MADAGFAIEDARPSRRRSLAALAIGIVCVALLAALGTWQVERLWWKQGVLRQIETRIHAQPVSVDAIAALRQRTGDVEYMPVAARGRFLNGAERFFISTFRGEAGWNVYAPLDLGANRFVFVNRGFVPYDRRDPQTRREGQIADETAVSGLARNVLDAKPSFLTPDNDIGRNQFFWKSIPDLVAGAGLPAGATVLPFVVDAGPGAAPVGWPVGGTTVIDIPNNHLQYAVTWYGLALALAAMLVYQVYRAYHPQPAGERRA